MKRQYYIAYLVNFFIVCCFMIYFYQRHCNIEPLKRPSILKVTNECPNHIVKEVVKVVPKEIIKEVPKEVIEDVTKRPDLSFCPKAFRSTSEVIRHCLPKDALNLMFRTLHGKKMPERTIYVIMKGRLGNHMFQMLGSLMFSTIMGTRLVYVTDSIDITKIFPLFTTEEEKIWKIKPTLAGLPHVNDTIGVSPGAVAMKILEHITKEDVVLDNYMIDHAYIDHARNGKCRNLLKRFFQFNCKDNEAAYNFLHLVKQHWLISRPEVKPNNISFIGIQVRRGDYTDKMWYDRGMRTPGKDYFFRAMQYFRDKFKNVIFIVATDDRPWCFNNIMTEEVYMSPQFNSAPGDMALLTHCNHTIGSVGSFTLWSSLLTGGIRTVYSISKQKEFIPAYVKT